MFDRVLYALVVLAYSKFTSSFLCDIHRNKIRVAIVD